MAELRFYHLTESAVESALAALLERSLAAGWRVAVRGGDAGRLEWLDERLWLGARESFLPHGLAGGPHDALQPVLLTTGRARPNGARCLVAVDGAEIGVDDLGGLERACLLFEGGDPAAVEAARGQWRRLVAAGVRAQYWTEGGGRWTKRAESG